MADDKGKKETESGEASAVPPVKSKKKLFIIIGGVVGLILLLGVPAAFFLLKSKPVVTGEVGESAGIAVDDGSLVEGAEDEDEYDENETPLGAIFPMDSFVVNLTGGKYLRIQIQLEFEEREVPKRFYARLVPVRDRILSLLASRTQDDISSQQGRDALRLEIKDLINEILRKEEVKIVYFTQFVVQ